MAQQLTLGIQQFFDANGNPLAGGSVSTYTPGTLTVKLTYQDSGLTTPNASTITLDSSGKCVMWGEGEYRLIVKDSLGNQIYDEVASSAVSPTEITDLVDSLPWLDVNTFWGDIPQYSNSTTFLVSGNLVSRYFASRRIRATISAGYIYGTISTSTYSTNTTVTVTWDGASLDSSLSAIALGAYSQQNAEVSSVAALRSVDISSVSTASTLGYHSAGDGGGNSFYVASGAAAETYTDNGGTIIVPTGGDGSEAFVALLGEVIRAKQFGYKGDTISLSDGTVSTATPTAFSSASASFTSADVGKLIAIQGAGVSGATLFTTIATYVDTNDVTLTTGASSTVTGAKFQYGTDDYTSLKNAIDYHLSSKIKLVIDSGAAAISAPLIAWDGTASYMTPNIEGVGLGWYSDSLVGPSTFIIPFFADTFALGIQNARSFRVANIGVIGQNTDVMNNATQADGWEYLVTETNYVTTGARDSQYSPYAGIVIDPFQTTTPSDGGYPGLSSWYTANAKASAGGKFENVSCAAFVANFIIGPDSAGNDSEISFYDCIAIYGKTGLSITQAQSRNVHWYAGTNRMNLYQFDGLLYGAQSGYAPKIHGCNVGGKYLFNVASNAGNTTEADGLHAESLMSLGFIGNLNTQSERDPANFTNCEIALSRFGASGQYSADIHLWSGGPINFEGGIINPPLAVTGSSETGMARFVCKGPVQVDSVTFQNPGVTTKVGLPIVVHDTGGSYPFGFENIDNCSVQDEASFGPTSSVSVVSQYQTAQLSNKASQLSNYGGVINDRGTLYRDMTNVAARLLSLGSLAITVNADGTASLTIGTAGTVAVGDIIFVGTNPWNPKGPSGGTVSVYWIALGVVTSVSGTGVTVSGVGESAVSGTYSCYSADHRPRLHRATTGDVATGTNTILNVTNISDWPIGSHIYGGGIPQGSYVTANDAASTLTISQNATASVTGERLYCADLQSFTGTAV